MKKNQSRTISEFKNDDTKVWRYMDFAKYVSMLSAGALTFARLDTFADPFEGSYTKSEYRKLREKAEHEEKNGMLPDEVKGHWFEDLTEHIRQMGRCYYVSCWHVSDGESEAMWRLYAPSGQGIAVKSSLNRLSAIERPPTRWDIVDPFGGHVEYVDFEADSLPYGVGENHILTKRLAFSHEKEFRVWFWKVDHIKCQSFGYRPEVLNSNPAVVNIPVSLDKIIEEVYVVPYAAPWFKDAVESVTRAYAARYPVRSSALLNKPYR